MIEDIDKRIEKLYKEIDDLKNSVLDLDCVTFPAKQEGLNYILNKKISLLNTLINYKNKTSESESDFIEWLIKYNEKQDETPKQKSIVDLDEKTNLFGLLGCDDEEFSIINFGVKNVDKTFFNKQYNIVKKIQRARKFNKWLPDKWKKKDLKFLSK